MDFLYDSLLHGFSACRRKNITSNFDFEKLMCNYSSVIDALRSEVLLTVACYYWLYLQIVIHDPFILVLVIAADCYHP